MSQFWLGLGILLVLAEFILPGLVSVFVGLGALTVVALLHFNYIESIPAQLITWFVSSTVYIFSLRLLVMRFYPSDTEKQNIDEDQLIIGQLVDVTETIPVGGTGRVAYGNTTWPAYSNSDQEVSAGEKVKVISRENITWLVEKPAAKES